MSQPLQGLYAITDPALTTGHRVLSAGSVMAERPCRGRHLSTPDTADS
mgnify:CR=1 FL=1